MEWRAGRGKGGRDTVQAAPWRGHRRRRRPGRRDRRHRRPVRPGRCFGRRPDPGWTPLQAPLPPVRRRDRPGGDDVRASPAVGRLLRRRRDLSRTARGNGQGLLEVYSGGSWSATEAPLPAAIPEPAPASSRRSARGAVGIVRRRRGVRERARGRGGDARHLRRGTLVRTEAPLPTGAATGGSADGFLKSVACATAESCVSTGFYATGAGGAGLIDTLSRGQWSGQAAPQPSDADTHQHVVLGKVSCPSVGACVAAGQFENSLGSDRQSRRSSNPGRPGPRTSLPCPATP